MSLKNLEETRSFYNVELQKEDLTKRERDKYLKALKLIEGFIKRKEKAGEKRKDKRFIAYDHKKALFQNSKRGY